MELRPYQTDIFDQCRVSYRARHRRVAVQSPTGSGKTQLFSYAVKRASEKGQSVLVIAHRQEIIDQISDTLLTWDVPHGVLSAGKFKNRSASVNVASVQTLIRRLDLVPKPDFIVIDECHHVAAKQWAGVFAHYSDAKYLGVTATPERLDGRGLGEFFNVLVRGPSVQWLIDRGFLAKPVYYGPPKSIDFSGVRKTAGDFNRGDLEAIMDTPDIIGDVVQHYRSSCMGARAVVFCVTLQHAGHVADSFCAAGIPAAVIDGKLDSDTRRQRKEDLKSGKVPVLVSCELVNEGFDLPTVEAAFLLRKTDSVALHLQQIGRALRPKSPVNQALIFDHVGNLVRLGLAEEERDWTLDGYAKKKRTTEPQLQVRQCKKCFAIYSGPKSARISVL